jgi:hypothetical protein
VFLFLIKIVDTIIVEVKSGRIIQLGNSGTVGLGVGVGEGETVGEVEGEGEVTVINRGNSLTPPPSPL